MKDDKTINSMGEASAAVARYEPQEFLGFTIRQVSWMQLDSLIETFNAHVLAGIKAYTGDDESVDPAAILSGAFQFANRLIALSCGLPLAEAPAHLEQLSLSQGAMLFATCLRVNLRDLRAVVDFFSDALSGVLSVSPNSTSTSGSAQDAAAAA